MAKEKDGRSARLEALEIEVHNLRNQKRDLEEMLRRSDEVNVRHREQMEEHRETREREQQLMLLCMEALGRGLASASKRR